jgi:pimeloyl-ACP methyl ester carboxylesterase
LIFDYRRLGESGGEPRQHLDPWDQIEDYRNAISHVERLDVVDRERIGIWGISYSGGHVLIAAAIDPRVRSVVSIVPVVDGLATMQRAHGTMGFRRLSEAILEARRSLFETGEHRYMKHSSTKPAEELCTWPFPGSPPLFQWLKESGAPNYQNRNTVASAELLLQYSVWPHVERMVDTPTLMVLAEGDDFTMWELEVRAFQAILTPKKELSVVQRTSHHDLYRDQEKLRGVAEVCGGWLLQTLVGQAT